VTPEGVSVGSPHASGPAMKLGDHILQRWRIVKARPFIPKGARVLDVGCHEGGLFRALGSRISYGVGVDPALSAPAKVGSFPLLAQSFPGELPTSEPFDVITMLAVVEHLPEEDLQEVQRECVRLLKPGGVVVITVPSPAVDRILHWLIRFKVVAGTAVHEHHGFEPGDLPGAFGKEGLRLECAKRFQLGLNNLFVFQRTGDPPAAGAQPA
jgi:SAM-dependent methyltransferase